MKTFYVGKRKIGVYDNGVFYKEVTRSLHLFRVIDSWGIDAKTLHSLPAKTVIKIQDLEDDILYTSTKEEYIEFQRYYHFKEAKKDHRSQIFLPRSYFTQSKKPTLTPDQKSENEYRMTQGLEPKYI